MSSIDIIELRKTDTGEKFYPLTHAEAVIGLRDYDFFERYELSDGSPAVKLKPEFAGLFTEGFLSAGGINSDSGGGGDTIEWEQLQTEGTHIANLTINGGTPIEIFAPVGGSGGGGTVTSVAAQGSGGISVSGSPITGSGTLNIGIGSGYKLPTTTEWNGKQDVISDLESIRSNAAAGAAKVSNVQSDWNANSGLARILNKPEIPSVYDALLTIRMNGESIGTFSANASSNKTIDLGTVLTSFTETDPVFSASPAAGITAAMIQSWTNKQEPLTAGTDYLTPQAIAQSYQPKVSALGSQTRPVYISSAGTFSQASTYAGGTMVTLNASRKGGATASFYAPTSSGTSTSQYLTSGGSSAAPVWSSPGSITEQEGGLVTGATVYAALQNYARNNAVVHLDGDETIDGYKTFIGGVEVVGWDSLLSTMEGETLADALAAKADNSDLGDYLPLTDFRFDILCKSVLGSDADLNKVYDTSYSDLTGHFRYYAYVGANPWPSVPGTQTTAGVHGFPTTSNANALLTIDTYSESDSLHLYQMGFSGDGNIYFRKGAAAKENGSWIDPWSNGNWNRLLWEDHNGDAAVTRDLSVSRQLNVAGDVVLPQSGGFWFDTAKSYINSAYFIRGDAAENDYSFYIHTGTDGGGNPAAMFIECGALYVYGGDVRLQKGNAVGLDAGRDAYITRGGSSADYSLYICAGHGSDGTSKVNTHVFTAALCPNATADQSNLGASNYVWNNLYAKRWYPDPTNAPDAYIEWDATNQAFKINGPVYSTGQVSAGGIFSNS